MTRVLLLDPDVARRDLLRHKLSEHGVLAMDAGDSAHLAATDFDHIDIVVSNAELPSGKVIAQRSRFGNLPLILFTDDPSVRCAVEAMQWGASDYLLAPFEPEELVAAIKKCLERTSPSNDDRLRLPTETMVGHCPLMLDLFDRIRTLAQTQTSLLIQGESGSGKELVARALHAASGRRGRPMISLNCATIPASLIESELFGDRPGSSDHRPGLVEAADEGTLFLDEISALTLDAQARLLHLLQEGELGGTKHASGSGRNDATVNVRVIAATHRDLQPIVAAGRFLEALYLRLNAATLTVPPLRERGGDIIELANWLLHRICHKLSKPELVLSEAALEVIGRYDWPGNVRELENALERAVILCDSNVIDAELLAIDSPKSQRRSTKTLSVEAEGETSLEGYFVKFVLEHQDALTETELANKLGISQRVFGNVASD